MGQLPKHVAIIMDGNGRWATQRGLRRVAGHRAGVSAVRRAVEYAAQQGIQVLTLFAFSLENLRRPALEVRFLMRLMLITLQREIDELHRQNIRLKVVGERSYLDDAMRSHLERAEALTSNNTGMTLVMLLHYSGRWDICQAMQRLVQQHPQLVDDTPQQLEAQLDQHLALHAFGEPDLLIRTSGEQRISNCLLWQLAYTELYFTDMLWPDFSPEEFARALAAYRQRERRFGKTSQQLDEKHYA